MGFMLVPIDCHLAIDSDKLALDGQRRRDASLALGGANPPEWDDK